MIRKRTLIVIFSLFTAVIVGSSATMPDEKHEEAKNLKVLPKKIDHKQLELIMKGWSKSLGVKCNFCHAQRQDDPKKLDFASDAKPEKNMARTMLKMTNKLNKKYFGHAEEEGAVSEVTCNTCHRGSKHPEGN